MGGAGHPSMLLLPDPPKRVLRAVLKFRNVPPRRVHTRTGNVEASVARVAGSPGRRRVVAGSSLGRRTRRGWKQKDESRGSTAMDLIRVRSRPSA